MAELEFAEQAKFFVKQEYEVRFRLQRLLHCGEVFADFDYVFFDCPPRLSTACVNALACSDYIITPTSLSMDDIDAVPRTLNWLKKLHPVVHCTFLGAVICRCTLRGGKLIRYEQGQLKRLETLIAEQLPGSGHVLEQMIPLKPLIYQSAGEGRPAVLDRDDGLPLFLPLVTELERRMHQ